MQLGIKKQQKYYDKVVILSHNFNVCQEKYTYDFLSVCSMANRWLPSHITWISKIECLGFPY